MNLLEWYYHELILLFSRSVVSDSLPPHGLQHARLPCPSPAPGACSNSCLLIQWCHPTISSSVLPFSSCPQSFPASGSFQMSQLFASGGQSTGVSASTSIPPMNTQDWSPLEWIGMILQSEGLSRVFFNITIPKASILWCSAFFMVQLSHPYMTTRKTIALTRWTFVGKVIPLFFKMLSRLAFLHNLMNVLYVFIVLLPCQTVWKGRGTVETKKHSLNLQSYMRALQLHNIEDHWWSQITIQI